MKVAVIGAGRMGAFHAETLHGRDEVSELRIYDADPERATVPSLEAALEGADAALIATPASTHAELIHLCLERGLPTFCEKPIALGLKETAAVVEHVARAGGVLQIGFQRRFDPEYVEARRRIADGGLGRVYSFYMAARDRLPPPDEYLPTSGGYFKDSHIHDFDLARWLFGREVVEVFATGGSLVSHAAAAAGDVDTTGVVLRLQDGTLGVLTGGRHNPAGYDIRCEVFGSLDSIQIGHRAPYRDFLDRFQDAYRAEVAHFLALVKGEAANPCTAEDALAALRIADACGRSVKTRRAVKV